MQRGLHRPLPGVRATALDGPLAFLGDAMVKKPAYTRLETDDEFRARVASLIDSGWARTYAAGLHGERLDTYVWDVYRKQRKIIEVYP